MRKFSIKQVLMIKSICAIVFMLRLLFKKNKLVILNYHRILGVNENDFSIFDRLNSDDFEFQIYLLSKVFNVISLNRGFELLEENKLPSVSVSITFDDGYLECHDKVLTILNKYHIRACFFITVSGMLNGKTWETEIEQCIEEAHLNSKKLIINDREFHVSSKFDAKSSVKLITDLLKYKTLDERKDYINKIKLNTGKFNFRRDYMTPEEVKRLHECGQLIGAHTMNHPILKIEDYELQKFEILESKKILEKLLATEVSLFAYPNGKFGKDFDQSTMNLVKEAGFSYAFSSDIGVFSNKIEEKYRIKRIMPWDTNPYKFALRILFYFLIDR